MPALPHLHPWVFSPNPLAPASASFGCPLRTVLPAQTLSPPKLPDFLMNSMYYFKIVLDLFKFQRANACNKVPDDPFPPVMMTPRLFLKPTGSYTPSQPTLSREESFSEEADLGRWKLQGPSRCPNQSVLAGGSPGVCGILWKNGCGPRALNGIP